MIIPGSFILSECPATTRKTGSLNLTLKGFVIFTAEPRRTLREVFFSFPLIPQDRLRYLRDGGGRKAKILSPTGHDDTLFGGW